MNAAQQYVRVCLIFLAGYNSGPLCAADMPLADSEKNFRQSYHLIQAVQTGDIVTVQEVLSQMPVSSTDRSLNTINVQDENGNTALMYACQQGSTDIVKALIEAKADLEIAHASYAIHGIVICHNALIESSHKGHKEIVKMLIEAGADVNTVDCMGNTALAFAAEQGHQEVVRILMDADAYLDTTDKHGNTALIFAADKGYEQIAKELIAAGAPVNKKDTSGNTALIYATKGGYLPIVQLLLDAGARLDFQNNRGNTALMYACRKGYHEIVRQLIAFRADVNVLNEKCNTALMFAVKKGYVEIVHTLIDAHADLTIQSWFEGHALQIAITQNHSELVRILIAANKTVASQTPLHTVDNNLDIMEQLLAVHERVNEPDELGDTLLIRACWFGHTAIVERLLKHPALDIDVKGADGKTAREMAYEFGRTDIMALLNAYEEEREVMIKPAPKRARPEERDDEQQDEIQ